MFLKNIPKLRFLRVILASIYLNRGILENELGGLLRIDRDYELYHRQQDLEVNMGCPK
jgi:hypothetical protein